MVSHDWFLVRVCSLSSLGDARVLSSWQSDIMGAPPCLALPGPLADQLSSLFSQCLKPHAARPHCPRPLPGSLRVALRPLWEAGHVCCPVPCPNPRHLSPCQRNQHPQSGVLCNSFNPEDAFPGREETRETVGLVRRMFHIEGAVGSLRFLARLPRPAGEQPTRVRHLPGPGACAEPPPESPGGSVRGLHVTDGGGSGSPVCAPPPMPADGSEPLSAILVPDAQRKSCRSPEVPLTLCICLQLFWKHAPFIYMVGGEKEGAVESQGPFK